MAYPGNLFALVARDRHFKSRTNEVMETKMEDRVEDDLGCDARRVRGKPRRRPSPQASTTSSTESSLAAGRKPRSVHALSCQSYQSFESYQSHRARGAKERPTPPPSEYGDRTDTRSSTDMDTTRGKDEAPDHQSEDRTLESDAVRDTVLLCGISATIRLPVEIVRRILGSATKAFVRTSTPIYGPTSARVRLRTVSLTVSLHHRWTQQRNF